MQLLTCRKKQSILCSWNTKSLVFKDRKNFYIMSTKQKGIVLEYSELQ